MILTCLGSQTRTLFDASYLPYVGHAERWNTAELDGRLDADTRDCTITYRHGGKKLIVAVYRDLERLQVEREFEKTMATQV
ncbi:hypothetical protein [Nitrospira sp. Nam74]